MGGGLTPDVPDKPFRSNRGTERIARAFNLASPSPPPAATGLPTHGSEETAREDNPKGGSPKKKDAT